MLLARAWLAIVIVGCGSPSAAIDGGGGATFDARALETDAARDVPDGAATDGATSDGATSDSASRDGAPSDAATRDAGPLALPPRNAMLDYQLGGAYPPPVGVGIVARDRSAPIVPGIYNVCYVNGFQIQPGEEAFWTSTHPDLILRDAGGAVVIDPDWDEMLIDVGTPEKRARVAAIVAEWIEGCAGAGYDAVEIDNLDSFSRSRGLLEEDDAVAAIALFADAAHAQGLAIAQKNAAELVSRRAEMGTDFAVSEECNRFSECGVFTGAYGDHVLIIEYRRTDFDAGCAAFPGLSIVLRDLDLTAPGDPGYVYEGC